MTKSAEVALDAAASDTSAAVSSTPRETLALRLADSLRGAIAYGDIGAARVAHEALGQLLGGAGGGPADVVDLAAHRRMTHR